MEKEPLVSIITPLYNSEKFIAETIESVIAQTYKSWEMIIVNDCSKDNGASIVKEYSKKDKRIKLFNNEKNLGGAGTRNRAIKEAKGKYLAFLDSDDIWTPLKLEKQISFMEENDFSFTFTEYEKIDEESKSLNKKVIVPKRVTYKKLLKANVIGCLTAIYNQEKLGKIYMPDVRKGQDFALWLEVLKVSKEGYGLFEVLGKYRIRDNSLSQNKLDRIKCNYLIFRKYNNLDIIQSSWCVLNNILEKVLKLRVKKIKN